MNETAIVICHGLELSRAKGLIIENHYTHTIPSGKSHYMRFGDAILVWSIPANKNISRFLFGEDLDVWELSRMWASDGHDRNLLSMAISHAVKAIRDLEHPDALVSYADPNNGHTGTVYKASGWTYHGQSEETRVYKDSSNQTVSRRAFHSGSSSMTKSQILAMGYAELKLPGKLRFVKCLSKKSKQLLR